jgi:hypothetical protein
VSLGHIRDTKGTEKFILEWQCEAHMQQLKSCNETLFTKTGQEKKGFWEEFMMPTFLKMLQAK